MDDKKKQQEKEVRVLVLVIPAYGHLNPMASFISELAKERSVKVFFPGNECDRKLIESARAEFRNFEFKFLEFELSANEWRNEFPLDLMIGKMMEAFNVHLERLVELVERERIDLIVYDVTTVYAKWLLLHLENLYKANKLTRRPPEGVSFCPSFTVQKNLFPNKVEEKFLPRPALRLSVIFRLVSFLFRLLFFYLKFGFKLENPINTFVYEKAKLNLCCVIPELQPRSHLFKSIKFVGSCASEELRSSKELPEPLKSFLAPFEARNPLPLNTDLTLDSRLVDDQRTKLIYVSFGTFFNDDISAFIKIIDGFGLLVKSHGAARFKLLVSTGDKSFARFQELIETGEFRTSGDVLLMSKVPQLDVLKRASLFITHSGQNSTSEAVHYGVPMVCIPVFGDQPIVAYRCSDELGLGVRIPYDDLTPERLHEALAEVLDSPCYLERVLLYSKISRKYNGVENATRLVMDVIRARLMNNEEKGGSSALASLSASLFSPK